MSEADTKKVGAVVEATALYRYYDADERLLYIGITRDPPRRMKEHAKSKPWWMSMRTMTLEWFDTRKPAEEAEREAIQAEHPLHNILHNSGTERTPMTVPSDSSTLFPGMLIGVAMREPIGTNYFLVGEVQAVDTHGIRITCMDWIIEAIVGFDAFVPWSNIIGGIEIATDEHDTSGWLEKVRGAQLRHNEAMEIA